MIVAAFFQLFEFHFEFVDIRCLHLILNRLHGELSIVDVSNFAVIQINNIIRVFDNWSCIRGDEEFAFFFPTPKTIGLPLRAQISSFG